MTSLFAGHLPVLEKAQSRRVEGRVCEVTGLTVVARGLLIPIGSMCRVSRSNGEDMIAQVVGLRGDTTVLMTLQDPQGVAAGDRVVSVAGLQYVPVGTQMLGTVLNGLGEPVDGRTDFTVEAHYPVFNDAPQALTRSPIDSVLSIGVRSIDAMHTVGGGQRLGIFAGTGVGKSVLLGMISRFTSADVTVVALVGERGREVGDFIRKDLGEEGMRRTVMVASTSHESPVLRVRAGFVATAVAEYFRDQGKDVLLLMDSTTRLAMAQRQIGLSAGEPPATKGYPPSVFALMPQLMERSGRTAKGSITGLYTVLVEGDDINEPISDTIRGILDGHIWLSRDLANRGHYPAVSVLESISRVMTDVASDTHVRAAKTVRRVLAVWNDIEDLVNIGAYAAGTNVEFDVAVKMKPAIDAFLQQSTHDRSSFEETSSGVVQLAEGIEEVRSGLAGTTAAAKAG